MAFGSFKLMYDYSYPTYPIAPFLFVAFQCRETSVLIAQSSRLFLIYSFP